MSDPQRPHGLQPSMPHQRGLARESSVQPFSHRKISPSFPSFPAFHPQNTENVQCNDMNLGKKSTGVGGSALCYPWIFGECGPRDPHILMFTHVCNPLPLPQPPIMPECGSV